LLSSRKGAIIVCHITQSVFEITRIANHHAARIRPKCVAAVCTECAVM
jgi:hypothetical protein